MNESGKKYLKRIILIGKVISDGVYYYGHVDVYATLKAFNVTCPARAHAIKKLLCAGEREKGSTLQDLTEARDAITRAIEIEGAKDIKNNEGTISGGPYNDIDLKKKAGIH